MSQKGTATWLAAPPIYIYREKSLLYNAFLTGSKIEKYHFSGINDLGTVKMETLYCITVTKLGLICGYGIYLFRKGDGSAGTCDALIAVAVFGNVVGNINVKAHKASHISLGNCGGVVGGMKEKNYFVSLADKIAKTIETLELQNTSQKKTNL